MRKDKINPPATNERAISGLLDVFKREFQEQKMNAISIAKQIVRTSLIRIGQHLHSITLTKFLFSGLS